MVLSVGLCQFYKKNIKLIHIHGGVFRVKVYRCRLILKCIKNKTDRPGWWWYRDQSRDKLREMLIVCGCLLSNSVNQAEFLQKRGRIGCGMSVWE